MTAEDVKKALQQHANADDAVFLQRFFKTGAGQYGAGDVFIGVRVPITRAVCKAFKDLPLPEIQTLLDSDVHEHRLAAVVLLTNQYAKASSEHRQEIFDLYLKNTHAGRINNWDLVDVSALNVVGRHLAGKSHKLLLKMARSDHLWDRRVAVLSTFYFLKLGDPTTSLEIAEILLHDTHDLIQKAVGWMLREIGKLDQQLLIDFLEKHLTEMPRTMLRYAVERLPAEKRIYFMKR